MNCFLSPYYVSPIYVPLVVLLCAAIHRTRLLVPTDRRRVALHSFFIAGLILMVFTSLLEGIRNPTEGTDDPGTVFMRKFDVQDSTRIYLDSGLALDVGTGPGRIPLKIARRNPKLRVVGVDRSEAMIQAARNAAREQDSGGRLRFLLGDANCLSFPDAAFDLVLSNSLLHHLADPVCVFREMERVTRAGGWILVRDLRRPSRVSFPWHAAWYGRHYAGLMRDLYGASLRAAYSPPELRDLLNRASLGSACPFALGRTHLGFVMQKEGH